MRYLSEADAMGAVRNGRSIEQFLSPRQESNYRALRWVCVKKELDGTIAVSRFEVFDQGSLDFLDLYEFSDVDPDNPSEELVGFSTVDDAIRAAEVRFGASPKKYVNAGIIQDEYKDFLLAAKRP